MDDHEIDAIRHDTFEPRPSLRELNEQWVTHQRAQQAARDRDQRRRDHAARHATLMDIAACLVGIKRLLGLLLLCTLLILLCMLLGRVPY